METFSAFNIMAREFRCRDFEYNVSHCPLRTTDSRNTASVLRGQTRGESTDGGRAKKVPYS